MHFFKSTEARVVVQNGKTQKVEKNVEIKNGKGTKTVIEQSSGEKPSVTTVPLSRDEIENIEGKNFIKGFWDNCAPGMPCYNNGGNGGNGGTNVIKNKNSRRRASKTRTRKQRRQ
jgi:hypothetical protein